MGENMDSGTNMKNRIEEIHNRIEKAKMRSGRINDDIMLIAVSKTQPYDRILEAQKNGLNIFGENKVQELVEKYPYISDTKWHLIGHLQKNKVKYIIDKVDLIHSVDSLGLAEEINRRAEGIGRKVSILIQINIGREESKSGIFVEQLDEFIEKIALLDNILVEGLMTIPPVNDEDNSSRMHFKKMKKLFDKIQKLDYKNINIKYLSMGMTDDYETAIEEGANIVRIGTGIFGKRVYKEE